MCSSDLTGVKVQWEPGQEFKNLRDDAEFNLVASRSAQAAVIKAIKGVNVDSFMRKITFQELTRDGLDALAPAITAMAEAEGLDAHANAVRVRMKGGIL